MRSFIAVLGMCALFAASPLPAQVLEYETVEAAADRFVTGGERNLASLREVSTLVPVKAAYGPFRVLDQHRAALLDVTDARSPDQFISLLRDHPEVTVLEMIECPGTEDDLANLRLGRLIRERQIATHVPDGGSVRSGGVELFIAGAHRFADHGAEFAVHSWMDETGLEPADYAADAPENRRYIDYYRQMGMSPEQARAFYAMTNSVPFASARWFDAVEMGRWVALEQAPHAGFNGREAIASAGAMPATVVVAPDTPNPGGGDTRSGAILVASWMADLPFWASR